MTFAYWFWSIVTAIVCSYSLSLYLGANPMSLIVVGVLIMLIVLGIAHTIINYRKEKETGEYSDIFDAYANAAPSYKNQEEYEADLYKKLATTVYDDYSDYYRDLNALRKSYESRGVRNGREPLYGPYIKTRINESFKDIKQTLEDLDLPPEKYNDYNKESKVDRMLRGD